ncbi:hypothetical protein U9M48_017579 [Paspalum notatum var. saurae]|uniref:Protein MON2 homolog n=1 Tax=Paspalum notatum var. saurae TaxID=547442 RepID=A0AAQ3WPC4_PASNO
MASMAALEADLRALSAEARRRHPAVKDAAEHAILKLRSLSGPSEIAQNEDILRMILMACSVKSVKLSVIGLSCLQKLISHGAVASSALKDILAALKDHAEMTDDIVQLKTLQTMLILFQSHLHPESEETMSQALGICLYLLESSRSSDSVRNTAAATFRQAVALVFDNVIRAESLPSGKASSARLSSRVSSVADNVTHSFSRTLSLASNSGEPTMKENLSDVGKLGLRLLEDLTALAAGGSATWLRVHSLHRTFALDILEFVLSTYVAIFRASLSYQQVLRHQICSLLMTSLRTNVELEGEAGEPSFRRLVLRLVSHVIRLYSSSLVTESEVFLNMLVKVTRQDLPLWHQILVLEILRNNRVREPNRQPAGITGWRWSRGLSHRGAPEQGASSRAAGNWWSASVVALGVAAPSNELRAGWPRRTRRVSCWGAGRRPGGRRGSWHGREPPSQGREESGTESRRPERTEEESRSAGVRSLWQQGAGRAASDVGRGDPRAGGVGQGSQGGAVAARGCVNDGGALGRRRTQGVAAGRAELPKGNPVNTNVVENMVDQSRVTVYVNKLQSQAIQDQTCKFKDSSASNTKVFKVAGVTLRLRL